MSENQLLFELCTNWRVRPLPTSNFIPYGQIEREPEWIGTNDEEWEYKIELLATDLIETRRQERELFGKARLLVWSCRIRQVPNGACRYNAHGSYCSMRLTNGIVLPATGRLAIEHARKDEDSNGWQLIRTGLWRSSSYVRELPPMVTPCARCEAVAVWMNALAEVGINTEQTIQILSSAEYETYVPQTMYNRYIRALQLIYWEHFGISNNTPPTVKKLKYRKDFRRTADRIIKEFLDLGIVTLEPNGNIIRIRYNEAVEPAVALDVLKMYGREV